MSIDVRCQEQRSAADRMFMDFKYTRPGSKEQVQALATLSFLIGMWADFLTAEEKRMDQVMALEAGNSQGLKVDHVGGSALYSFQVTDFRTGVINWVNADLVSHNAQRE